MVKGAGVLAGLAAVGAGGVFGVREWTRDSDKRSTAPDPAESPGKPPSLDRLADNVVPGGPGKDGIPPIDKPRFVEADEADFLSDDQPVFGLEAQGGERPRAYPQLVLVWHEIVNDKASDGKPLTVTYCPLTGTAIAFTGPPDGAELTFGTTGNLVNSNLVMYDRQTQSTWPQITGTAITGRRKGQRLATTALVWSTWKAWRTARPNTRVLSRRTGHLRDYGSDPYGSYTDESGYYTDAGLIFPVLEEDPEQRFGAKDVVIAVQDEKHHLAILKERIRRERTVRARLGDRAVTVEWDRALDTARLAKQGSDGKAEAFDAMWFAWYAFHPDTKVLS